MTVSIYKEFSDSADSVVEKLKSTEHHPETNLHVESKLSNSNDDPSSENTESDKDVLPQSSESDVETTVEDVITTEKSNSNEQSTVPGAEENIRDENSNNEDANEDDILAQDKITDENGDEKDIIGVTNENGSDKPKIDSNENQEKTPDESETGENSKDLDQPKAVEGENVIVDGKDAEDNKATEDNAETEENAETDDNAENEEEAEDNVEAYTESDIDSSDEYDPNEENLENQYVESQDDYENEGDEEEIDGQTTENPETMTDRFGREMGRESSPMQKFVGLVAIIVMASMLVYFLKFQTPRLEKDETRYQPLNDVDDSPEHVHMSLINGTTDDADDDDEEDEVWKWS